LRCVRSFLMEGDDKRRGGNAVRENLRLGRVGSNEGRRREDGFMLGKGRNRTGNKLKVERPLVPAVLGHKGGPMWGRGKNEVRGDRELSHGVRVGKETQKLMKKGRNRLKGKSDEGGKGEKKASARATA